MSRDITILIVYISAALCLGGLFAFAFLASNNRQERPIESEGDFVIEEKEVVTIKKLGDEKLRLLEKGCVESGGEIRILGTKAELFDNDYFWDIDFADTCQAGHFSSEVYKYKDIKTEIEPVEYCHCPHSCFNGKSCAFKSVCEDTDGNRLSLDDARKIAAKSDCADHGQLSMDILDSFCDPGIGLWRIKLITDGDSCDLSCLVNIKNKTARYTWGCDAEEAQKKAAQETGRLFKLELSWSPHTGDEIFVHIGFGYNDGTRGFYRLYKREGADGEWSLYNQNYTKTTAISVADYKANKIGTTYYYYMTEIVDGVESKPSETKSITVQIPPCDDTDANASHRLGVNYYKRGYVKGLMDRCTSSDMLLEYSCGTEVGTFNTPYRCEYGCKDGACLTSEPVEAQNTEAGQDVTSAGGDYGFKKGPAW